MTNEEAIQYNKNLREYMKISDKESEYKFSEENYIALDMANKALEIVNDFESAQIITGGRLNGRTYAYKCGLADGQRLAKGEDILERTRWIPVSERLPKENEYIGDVCKYYFIQDEYGDMHVAHLSNVGWIPMGSLKAIGDEIIAWQELPEPYKESEE